MLCVWLTFFRGGNMKSNVTIYEKDGVRAELVDGEAILVYCEGVASLEMTLQEWKEISKAMEGYENA